MNIEYWTPQILTCKEEMNNEYWILKTTDRQLEWGNDKGKTMKGECDTISLVLNNIKTKLRHYRTRQNKLSHHICKTNSIETKKLSPSLETQIPALRPKSLKLTKHKSSPPSGPLPLWPTHTHIHSHRGNGYRWPSNAFATITPYSKFRVN